MSEKFKTVVIKIGTRVLSKSENALDEDYIKQLVSQVSQLLDRGKNVILVSSGAIGAGMGLLNLKERPSSLSELQATAAIGQNQLMNLYNTHFKKKGYLAGQILLTQEDFDDRKRYLNIKYTIKTLFEHKVVPIVNENDTVSTDEIKCGDNDRLSSLVADLAGADMLIILTDVEGLYDSDGNLIEEVTELTGTLKAIASGKGGAVSTGGMATKIEAADNASKSGIECFIVNGRYEGIILKILEGKARGTHFRAKTKKIEAKKRWIAFSSKTKGALIVDSGARDALVKKKTSLLARGVVGKEGRFGAGDVVSILDKSDKEFARGLTNYSSDEIEKIKGLKTSEIESVLGYKDHDEVIHRDNLVIL